MRADDMDQTSHLRKLQNVSGSGSFTQKGCASAARVMAVTSGKGGVGKTNVVANLAYLFCQLGKKVFVFDADVGLANIDIVLGLTPLYNLQHVLSGEKSIADVIIEGPGGMKILPARSGVQALSELTHEQKLYLLSEFESLNETYDIFMIDTGAGISSNVMYFNMAAQEKIVVATPEPTSITDAYAMMKVMSIKYAEKSFKLIVNEARDEKEADAIYRNLSAVAEKFLNISIDYLGYIIIDKHVSMAVRSQKPVAMAYPRAKASTCMLRLAKRILDRKPAAVPSGNIGFLWSSLLGAGTHQHV